jgi:hypothetical protein
MPVERHTFKIRRFSCGILACGVTTSKLLWDYDPPPACSGCGEPTRPEVTAVPGRASAILGDEIDVIVENGPVNPDGSPRRYRSRAELNRETAALGWQREGDTPHPEKIDWDRR